MIAKSDCMGQIPREEIRRKNMRLAFAICCFVIGFAGTEFSAIASYHVGVFPEVWDAVWFGILVGLTIGIVLAALFWDKL